jgi:hypothetical protein
VWANYNFSNLKKKRKEKCRLVLLKLVNKSELFSVACYQSKESQGLFCKSFHVTEYPTPYQRGPHQHFKFCRPSVSSYLASWTVIREPLFEPPKVFTRMRLRSVSKDAKIFMCGPKERGVNIAHQSLPDCIQAVVNMRP